MVLAVITGWEPTGLPAGRRRRCWCRRRGRLINVRRRGRVRTGSRCSPQLESSEENQDENCDTARPRHDLVKDTQGVGDDTVIAVPRRCVAHVRHTSRRNGASWSRPSCHHRCRWRSWSGHWCCRRHHCWCPWHRYLHTRTRPSRPSGRVRTRPDVPVKPSTIVEITSAS